MSDSKEERIKKAVAATKAPDQVVRRPVPALGLFIAAAAQNANLATNVSNVEAEEGLKGPAQTFSKDENVIAPDCEFPVARKTSPITPKKTSRMITPSEYSGKLEKKLNLEPPRPPLNPWSTEAYSIFEGNLESFICFDFVCYDRNIV